MVSLIEDLEGDLPFGRGERVLAGVCEMLVVAWDEVARFQGQAEIGAAVVEAEWMLVADLSQDPVQSARSAFELYES